MQPFSLTAFQLLLQQLMNETDVHSRLKSKKKTFKSFANGNAAEVVTIRDDSPTKSNFLQLKIPKQDFFLLYR